jgi:hypothetical protein
MSIRQHRLNTEALIRSRIADFKGKKINIVLTNKTSVLGKLKSVDELGFVLENGRQKNVRFSFQEVSELYFDQIV